MLVAVLAFAVGIDAAGILSILPLLGADAAAGTLTLARRGRLEPAPRCE